MESKLRPAAWGGLFIGVLSSLPFISGLNACCCLWVIAGGVLTTYLLQESSRGPVQAGDAAIAGLLAGVVGAVLGTVLSTVVAAVTATSMPIVIDRMLERGGDLPPALIPALERARHFPAFAWFGFALGFYLVVYPIFSMLGSLLGVAIFKRNSPPPPGTVEVLPPE